MLPSPFVSMAANCVAAVLSVVLLSVVLLVVAVPSVDVLLVPPRALASSSSEIEPSSLLSMAEKICEGSVDAEDEPPP